MMTLKTFYAEFRTKVHLWEGAESRHFAVQRGVRQGDPLSTLLFNLVLNEVLQEVRVAWEHRGYGTEVGRVPGKPRLTHVAFADDCTLVARSWLSLKRMVLELREGLEKRGLSLHPTKCQVQTNVMAGTAVDRFSSKKVLHLVPGRRRPPHRARDKVGAT